MEFIEQILQSISNTLSMKSFGLDKLYLVASIVLPIFYYKQIHKYLNGENGVGDFCFQTEIIQASLRIPALLYCICIANGPVFISVLLDLIGRSAKINTAKIVQTRHTTKNISDNDETDYKNLSLVTD